MRVRGCVLTLNELIKDMGNKLVDKSPEIIRGIVDGFAGRQQAGRRS